MKFHRAFCIINHFRLFKTKMAKYYFEVLKLFLCFDHHYISVKYLTAL